MVPVFQDIEDSTYDVGHAVFVVESFSVDIRGEEKAELGVRQAFVENIGQSIDVVSVRVVHKLLGTLEVTLLVTRRSDKIHHGEGYACLLHGVTHGVVCLHKVLERPELFEQDVSTLTTKLVRVVLAGHTGHGVPGTPDGVGVCIPEAHLPHHLVRRIHDLKSRKLRECGTVVKDRLELGHGTVLLGQVFLQVCGKDRDEPLVRYLTLAKQQVVRHDGRKTVRLGTSPLRKLRGMLSASELVIHATESRLLQIMVSPEDTLPEVSEALYTVRIIGTLDLLVDHHWSIVHEEIHEACDPCTIGLPDHAFPTPVSLPPQPSPVFTIGVPVRSEQGIHAVLLVEFPRLKEVVRIRHYGRVHKVDNGSPVLIPRQILDIRPVRADEAPDELYIGDKIKELFLDFAGKAVHQLIRDRRLVFVCRYKYSHIQISKSSSSIVFSTLPLALAASSIS